VIDITEEFIDEDVYNIVLDNNYIKVHDREKGEEVLIEDLLDGAEIYIMPLEIVVKPKKKNCVRVEKIY